LFYLLLLLEAVAFAAAFAVAAAFTEEKKRKEKQESGGTACLEGNALEWRVAQTLRGVVVGGYGSGSGGSDQLRTSVTRRITLFSGNKAHKNNRLEQSTLLI
jgi:hypothetical protein